ncbi:MAG: hypothetical protein AAGF27_00625 [Pseudomonadota bacterium]
MRMALWARNPPSAKRIAFVFAVVAGAIAVYGLEFFGLWPEALTAERMRP